MIIYRKKPNTWTVMAIKADSNYESSPIVGVYNTHEEAKASEVEYKARILAQGFDMLKEKLTKKAEDMLVKYNPYLELCSTTKTITEVREGMGVDINTAQNTIKSLLARGYIESSIMKKANVRKFNAFTTIKMMTFDEAFEYVSPRKYNTKANQETLPGARVINFDTGNVRQRYTEQRQIDRANMKSPKNYISGATMSASDW